MAKRGILEHPKTMELADLLEIPECYAVGILECLWHHVARYFRSGDVSSLKPGILARSIRYPGDPQGLWDALHCAGFLETLADGRTVVHDWSEHADNSVHQILKKRGERFADGHAPFTRSRIRDMNASEEELNGSQTVHEPFTNQTQTVHASQSLSLSQTHEDRHPKTKLASNARVHDGAVRAKAEPPGPHQEAAELLLAGRNILYRFTGAEVVGRQREDALSQLAAHLENGRTVDLDLLERAVGRAEESWRENGDGKRRGVGWVLNAVRDLLLEGDEPGGPSPRAPQYDNDERLDRRRELISAGMKGDEAAFQEAAAGWAARLEALGYSPAEVSSEVGRLLEDARLNVKAIKGARNGRAGRPDAADPQPADSRS